MKYVLSSLFLFGCFLFSDSVPAETSVVSSNLYPATKEYRRTNIVVRYFKYIETDYGEELVYDDRVDYLPYDEGFKDEVERIHTVDIAANFMQATFTNDYKLNLYCLTNPAIINHQTYWQVQYMPTRLHFDGGIDINIDKANKVIIDVLFDGVSATNYYPEMIFSNQGIQSISVPCATK